VWRFHSREVGDAKRAEPAAGRRRAVRLPEDARWRTIHDPALRRMRLERVLSARTLPSLRRHAAGVDRAGWAGDGVLRHVRAAQARTRRRLQRVDHRAGRGCADDEPRGIRSCGQREDRASRPGARGRDRWTRPGPVRPGAWRGECAMSALRSLRGSAAVAGVATCGLGEAPGFTDMELLARSARAAVADAGLKMSDIDGLCTASVGASMWTMPVIEYLGIQPSFINGTMLGGS